MMDIIYIYIYIVLTTNKNNNIVVIIQINNDYIAYVLKMIQKNHQLVKETC